MSRDHVEAEIKLEGAELLRGARASLRFRLIVRAPVKIRGAHVHFAGFEETKAVYTTSDGKTTTTHTATERNALVDGRKTFQGSAPAGFFANLSDAALTVLGGGDHEKLSEGMRDVVLEVDLPEDLPASFEAKKVKVSYEAALHLDIPAGRDFRHSVTFPLGPHAHSEALHVRPLSIRYPEDSGRGFFDSMFGPDVAMRVDLDSTVVPRGGTLSGELEVRFPDKPPTVKAVVCQLLRREKTKAQGHSDGHAEILVTERVEQRESTSNSLFVPISVRVPDDVIPTCSGAKFSLAHELAISLDVPWAKDPTIRIPITIA
jgi:hypothetical protein